jgi:hypothetical protein
MSKPIDNKSGNLKEILMAIADGKAVQFFMDERWNDFLDGHTAPYGKTMLKKEWRIKPDAFEETWEYCLSWGLASFGGDEALARYIWDAAMGHKEQ